MDRLTAESIIKRTRVEQKWGFGLAPVRQHIQQQRRIAARMTLDLLQGPSVNLAATLPENLSVTKGLYSRTIKQDQWDWFTVWQQLGRPTSRQSRLAAEALSRIRKAVIDADAAAISHSINLLHKTESVTHLTTFLTGQPGKEEGVGYIYILSTREHRHILKIGYTERSVEERVKEINRATGILIPFGVRALWAVTQARTVEAEVHARLSPYRVRQDREFFELEFGKARKIIQEHLSEFGYEA